MRIVCIGGGPAGLYFAISAKLRDAGHDITVIERDPPGATYGWGVVYWDDLLDILFRNDPDSARALRAESVLWQEQRVILRSEQTAHLPGYGFSVGRATLHNVLGERASELGIDVQYRQEVDDLAALGEADLVVVSDGAHSKVRQRHGEHFGARVDVGGNPYIWLGTDKVFDHFTFAFEQTSAGWVWFHAYPSSAGTSTCIVECTQQTWQRLADTVAGVFVPAVLSIAALTFGGWALAGYAFHLALTRERLGAWFRGMALKGASNLRTFPEFFDVHIARAPSYDDDFVPILEKQYEHFRARVPLRLPCGSAAGTAGSRLRARIAA